MLTEQNKFKIIEFLQKFNNDTDEFLTLDNEVLYYIPEKFHNIKFIENLPLSWWIAMNNSINNTTQTKHILSVTKKPQN